MYLHTNLSHQDFVDIIGPDNKADEFFNIDPDDLRRMLQVQPLTESITSVKDVNLNQMIQAFDRLVQLPEVNRAALVKQLLLRLGQKDIKEILPQLSGLGQEATMEGMANLNTEALGGPGGGPPMGAGQ